MIVRALKRNPYTANQPIRVRLEGTRVVLEGSVNHADLIPEAVVTVEAISPLLRVYSQLDVRGARAEFV